MKRTFRNTSIVTAVIWGSSTMVTAFNPSMSGTHSMVHPSRVQRSSTAASSSTRLQTATTSASSFAQAGNDETKEEEIVNPFLDDGNGHINPELATRIYKWEQEQRVNLNMPEFKHSTRQGLRWVQEVVAATSNSAGSSGTSSKSADRYEDMIQEGVITLMQAMTQYEHDARPNESFEAFAKFKIRKALETYSRNSKQGILSRKALSMETTVEITDPLETHYSNQEEWEVREGLVLDNGQSVDREELVEDFLDETIQYEGEDQMWVHQQQVAAPLRDSIPDGSTEGEESLLLVGEQSMTPDDMALADMIRFDVDEFLGSTLDDLESQIIQMRFGLDNEVEGPHLPKTQKEVAYELGVSVSRVRKVQKSALEKLREAYSDRYVGNDEDDFWEDSV